MEIEYRRAGPGDLELLVRVRALVLKAANGLPEGADMAPVEGPSREYYARALAEATPMGRPLYEAFGFAPLADEMGLTL